MAETTRDCQNRRESLVVLRVAEAAQRRLKPILYPRPALVIHLDYDRPILKRFSSGSVRVDERFEVEDCLRKSRRGCVTFKFCSFEVIHLFSSDLARIISLVNKCVNFNFNFCYVQRFIYLIFN